jgi:hypothetical protein
MGVRRNLFRRTAWEGRPAPVGFAVLAADQTEVAEALRTFANARLGSGSRDPRAAAQPDRKSSQVRVAHDVRRSA